MADPAALLPVNLLTGFLGSGKTTLLQRLLAAPGFRDTAVLINEFGEVGLDHHLLETVDRDIVLLQSGCLCCTIRGDLRDAIRDLHSRRERGVVPEFRRLVIETTGLADPAPIVSTILSEPVIRHHFRPGNVICTVDAVNGLLHLERQPESVKQVTMADRILLTKVDLAEPVTVGRLRAKLEALNPSAPCLETACGVDPDWLLAQDFVDPERKLAELRGWIASAREGGEDDAPQGHAHNANRHDERIHAFALVFDRPLDWTAFGVWLTMLLQSRGEDVLRIKGILNVADAAAPVAVHSAQHLVHPPIHLQAWPDDDRRSRLVFILRDIPRDAIERSLATFARLGADPQGAGPRSPGP